MTKKILMLLFAAVLALATARHAFAQGPSNNQEQATTRTY